MEENNILQIEKNEPSNLIIKEAERNFFVLNLVMLIVNSLFATPDYFWFFKGMSMEVLVVIPVLSILYLLFWAVLIKAAKSFKESVFVNSYSGLRLIGSLIFVLNILVVTFFVVDKAFIQNSITKEYSNLVQKRYDESLVEQRDIRERSPAFIQEIVQLYDLSEFSVYMASNCIVDCDIFYRTQLIVVSDPAWYRKIEPYLNSPSFTQNQKDLMQSAVFLRDRLKSTYENVLSVNQERGYYKDYLNHNPDGQSLLALMKSFNALYYDVKSEISGSESRYLHDKNQIQKAILPKYSTQLSFYFCLISIVICLVFLRFEISKIKTLYPADTYTIIASFLLFILFVAMFIYFYTTRAESYFLYTKGYWN